MANDAEHETPRKLVELLTNIATTQAQLAGTFKSVAAMVIAMREKQHGALEQMLAQLVKLVESKHTTH